MTSTLPQNMRCIVARQPGEATALQVVTVPTPSPGPGQVLIRIEAASVNYSDLMRRRGQPYPFPTIFPYVPGSEIAGSVAAVGPETSAPAIGTAVMAIAGVGPSQTSGGYAQFCLAEAATVHALPPGLDVDVAAGAVVNGATAVLALRDCGALAAGETVLIEGAAGGVGSYAREIARELGASLIIAGVGSHAKAAALQKAGVAAVVNLSEPGWTDAVRALSGGRGVDVLLAISGGALFRQGLQVMAPFGRTVICGDAAAAGYSLDAATAAHLFADPMRCQSLIACNLGLFFGLRPAAAGSAVGLVIGGLLSGRLTPPPITVMPLADASLAHLLLERRELVGKVILKPWA